MISLIAAIGKNFELGKNNDLIWKLKEDLQFFKNTTMNKTVIMGFNTYKSIGKCLPNRRNVVLSKNKEDVKDINVIVYDNIDELINKELNNNQENFIIGGASLYNYFYNLADRMYLTLIEDTDSAADVYFPKIEDIKWHKQILANKCENGIKYSHVLYERKKK